MNPEPYFPTFPIRRQSWSWATCAGGSCTSFARRPRATGVKAGNAASDAMDASDGSDDEDNSVRGGAMRAFKAEVIEVIGELIDEL